MGAAPMAYVLWDHFLKHNPADPKWPDRDRFVLSAGHASAMLYALLYLTGYDLSLDDIKQFRQWGSRTPGHPEFGITPGVEATTGPLGQGFGNAVGMAVAQDRLAKLYNRPGFPIFDHYIYALVSDGDLQEGVASEAASLAGTLQLDKLIFLYDDNEITIEGNTGIAFAENVGQRFLAYGWNVIDISDGMDTRNIFDAISRAKESKNHPTLIICPTIIGFGSPNKAGTAEAHGEPLGAAEVKLTRERLQWPYPEPFAVPPEALAHFRQAQDRGRQLQLAWEQMLVAYRKAYPNEAKQLAEDLSGGLPDGWDAGFDELFKDSNKPVSTRVASGKVMNLIAQKVRPITGGSADLAPSTKTILNRFCPIEEYIDPNMHFGVREHAMGAIANGMALNGGLIPYTATFLMFYDYMRPPVRLAALMRLRVIFIFTHDSIGLGQDGPTHQPVEHLMGMRAVPNLVTIRPADASETAAAWRVAMERRDGPTALVLTRQDLPVFNRSEFAPARSLERGGYILWEGGKKPDVILIGTGSEVHIALQAGKILQAKGIAARVVSMASWELFDAQPGSYRDEVLPPGIIKRVSIEAAAITGWEHYVGLDGVAMGISRFGESAPGEVIYQKLGLTAENMAEKAMQLLRKV
jgi:transketolase